MLDAFVLGGTRMRVRVRLSHEASGYRTTIRVLRRNVGLVSHGRALSGFASQRDGRPISGTVQTCLYLLH